MSDLGQKQKLAVRARKSALGQKQKLSFVTNVRAMLELKGQANVKHWPRPPEVGAPRWRNNFSIFGHDKT
jgi:hypothetical protein